MSRLALFVLLVPSLAIANPPEVVTESYRAHTLTVDGVGLSLAFAGTLMEGGGDGYSNTNSEQLLFGGIAVVSLGTPLVHALHGHGWRAAGSIAMRGMLAMVGISVANAVIESDCDRTEILCMPTSTAYGYFAGTALAIALDAMFLTDEIVAAPSWAPQLSASPDGFRAGVALTF